MKRIIPILLSSLLLSGCMAFDAYNTGSTDKYEYERITNIRAEAAFAKDKCSATEPFLLIASSSSIYSDSILLKTYTEGLNNQPITNMAQTLFLQIKDFHTRVTNKDNPISQIYCEEKIQNIYDNATTIQKAIGKGLK